MKGIAISAILALLVVLPLSASNMGLALRMQLDSTSQPLHFISLPFLYTPATAEALCQDLGGSGNVAEILRWDGASSVFVEYACGSGAGDFALDEAAGGMRTLSMLICVCGVLPQCTDLPRGPIMLLRRS